MMGKKLTQIEFIEKAIKAHDNKYDYSLIEYVNNSTKIKIICPMHGIFEKRPNDHIYKQKQGCNKCSRKFPLGNNRFIERSEIIHGKGTYDYSKVNYKRNDIKIIIICKKHGEFDQEPCRHLLGNGCQKCQVENFTYTTEKFINKAKLKHGDKYDYELVNYIKSDIKVKIICKEHGIFEQKPNKHLQGQDCYLCGLKKQSGKNHWNYTIDRNRVKTIKLIQNLSSPYRKRFREKYNVSKGYDIDHIFPVKAFVDYGIYNLEIINLEENLQALPLSINRKKNSKYDKQEFEEYLKNKNILIQEF